MQKASRAVPDIPWGVWLKASRPKAVRQVAEMGADFLVFPAATTPLALLEGKETSRILEVELSLGEGWLRVASELPVDAVLVTSCRGDFLAWQDLLVFQRLSDVLTRPLLAATPLAVTGSELQALWEAGVSAIVVEAGASQPQSGLKGLRRLIDGLDFPLPRRREKTRPLLPSLGVKAGAETYESEDEDEEE